LEHAYVIFSLNIPFFQPFGVDTLTPHGTAIQHPLVAEDTAASSLMSVLPKGVAEPSLVLSSSAGNLLLNEQMRSLKETQLGGFGHG
jgi:hypothetical protein